MEPNTYCDAHKVFNCSQCRISHNESSLTQRLKRVLEYVEQSDVKPMRIFTKPEPSLTPEQRSSGIIVKEINEIIHKPIKPNAIISVHENNVSSVPMPRSEPIAPSTTDNIHTASTTTTVTVTSDTTTESNEELVVKFIGNRYKTHHKHKFAKVEDVTYASFTTFSRRYSEIVTTIWLGTKLSTSGFTVERWRILLSMMYDAEENIWSVSARLIKRIGYSVRDEEELFIPNRLCISSELRSELKRMLLYIGISPRQAYRLFRKAMSDECVITRSEEYGFITVESSTNVDRNKQWDKPIPTAEYNAMTNQGYQRSHYPYGGAHSMMRDPEKMQEAMAQYDNYWGND